MFDKILDAIHARVPGYPITIVTGRDGIVILKVIPMAAALLYKNHSGETLASIRVVRGGFVEFTEAIYQKWAKECIAAREGKSSSARPRPWKPAGVGGGWQQK